MQPRDLEDVEVDEDMELDDELCRDIQMKLPDCLWQLDYVGRYAAGKFNEDFASLDSGERFLFGVIEVPFTEEAGSFTWGVWAEVAPADHDAYLLSFQSEMAEGRVMAGRIANDIPGSPDAVGARVELVLHADRRPEIRVWKAVSQSCRLEVCRSPSMRRSINCCSPRTILRKKPVMNGLKKRLFVRRCSNKVSSS